MQNITDFLADLSSRVEGSLRDDLYSRMLYSTDASIYQVMPHAVLVPKNVNDVHAAVSLAAERKIPIVPRTAGSSLAGQAIGEALIIDFSRNLDQVLEFNREEKWVRVEPGIVLDELNLFLKPQGFQFGPDPASSNRAAMGGIVANNSTGSHSILYGMTADHVLELDTILSDGSQAHLGPVDQESLQQYRKRSGLEGKIYQGVLGLAQANVETILQGTPRHWRRCGGYNLDRFIKGASFKYPQDPRFNLAKLICGSEGTLGVMTELKLNVVPLPKLTGLGVVHFDSLYEALSSVPAMLETDPSAIELLDNLGLTLCRGVPQYARLLSTFIDGNPNCVLITEFRGDSEQELQMKVNKLKRRLDSHGVKTRTVAAINPDIQGNVWAVRKVGLGLMMSIKGDHKPIPFIEDAAVPPEHLADYVTEIQRFCAEIGTDRVPMYAHASAGCLHIRPLINAKVATEVEKLPLICSFAVELLGRYGGSWSSEHGDGRARSWLNEQFFGRDLYQLYREVKELFDPAGILNPGQVVDAPPMTENLRYGGSYKTIQISEDIDFSEDQGFDRAVEMCNGAGICRKKTEGTMCPSFMVTREEEHSTRGRANLLRAAMSGRLPHSDLDSQRLYDAMDLCIECKACKAECPSSVDMAKIKFQYLANYYKNKPIPLRVKIFSAVAKTGRINSGFLAPFVNGISKLSIVRWLMEKFLGISRKRQLPEFASVPFTQWFAKHESKNKQGNLLSKDEKSVVLFNDTHSTYYDTGVAIAATEILEAAGFRVVVPNHKCCGRPMISKGLVDQARGAAQAIIEQLYPLVERGMPIIGLEPSCILTFKDEYLSLLPNDDRAKEVANAAITFEEFVMDKDVRGEFELAFKAVDKKVLLHGHCHQKSLVGTEPVRKVLEMVGFEVDEVDSGCCGMAGSFGYEKEHYEISMAMAERRLLPAIRAAGEDSLVVASGTSCRAQILHGAGHQALHTAQVLNKYLERDT